MLCFFVDVGDREQLKALLSELKVLIHIGQHLNLVNLVGAVTTQLEQGWLTYHIILINTSYIWYVSLLQSHGIVIFLISMLFGDMKILNFQSFYDIALSIRLFEYFLIYILCKYFVKDCFVTQDTCVIR